MLDSDYISYTIEKPGSPHPLKPVSARFGKANSILYAYIRINLLDILQPGSKVVIPAKQYVAPRRDRAIHVPRSGKPVMRHEEMPRVHDDRTVVALEGLEIGRADPGMGVEEDKLVGVITAEADDGSDAAGEGRELWDEQKRGRDCRIGGGGLISYFFCGCCC